MRVAIVGAGVSGLTTANALLEQHPTPLHLHIIAQHLPVDTHCNRCAAQNSSSCSNGCSSILPLSNGRKIKLLHWKNGLSISSNSGTDVVGAVFHHICSRVAAASFLPHSSAEKAPSERHEKWIRRSADEFLSLARLSGGDGDGDGDGDSGVRLVDGMECFASDRDHLHDPWWSDICTLGFEHLDLANECESDPERSRLREEGYRHAWRFQLPIIDTSVYLPYLLRRIESASRRMGHVLRIVRCAAPIRSLEDELYDKYDVVINCAGTGAVQLRECDEEDSGCRTGSVGGVVIVERLPGVHYHWIRDDTAHNKTAYIYPRVNDIVLGGNRIDVQLQRDGHHEGINDVLQSVDWSKEAARIVERCAQLYPQIRNSKVLQRGVCGVRPSRTGGIRLEARQIKPSFDGKKSIRCRLLVTNYGHGGEGYCYSHGCAQEVVELVMSHLQAKL